MALAPSLPPDDHRPFVLGVTYIVVVSSIVVQGMTITRLVRRAVPDEEC